MKWVTRKHIRTNRVATPWLIRRFVDNDEVGNTQYDPASNRIFAAVQTRNQLVTVNPKTQQVVSRYDLPGCDHPHGLFINSAHCMAYVACEDNAKLVALSLTNMQVTSTHFTHSEAVPMYWHLTGIGDTSMWLLKVVLSQFFNSRAKHWSSWRIYLLLPRHILEP